MKNRIRMWLLVCGQALLLRILGGNSLSLICAAGLSSLALLRKGTSSSVSTRRIAIPRAILLPMSESSPQLSLLQ